MSTRAWVLFIGLSVVWGTPYLLIKVAVEEIPPASLVFLRCALGAALLLPLVISRGRLRAVLPYWRPVLVFALLEMTVPWFLLAWAEQTLSSSLTGVLIALVPLVAVAAAVALRHDDLPDRRRTAGMLVGLAGVAVLLGLDLDGAQVWPVVALLVVVVCYATAPLLAARALTEAPGDAVSAVALAMTALVYLPVGLPQLAAAPVPSTRALLAVLALAVVCTAVALVMFFALIREAGPHRAVVITYLNPVVAVALGVGLLGESLTRGMILGLPLIIAGCVVATRRRTTHGVAGGGGVDLVTAAPPEAVVPVVDGPDVGRLTPDVATRSG